MLTDTSIKALKPKLHQYKLSDSNGLYLLIKPSGQKFFRFDFKFEGKRQTLSIGIYPQFSLKAARQKVVEAKSSIKDGISPIVKNKTKQAVNTFGVIATEWLNKQKTVWKDTHTATVQQRIKDYILPALGDKEIATITTTEILSALRDIENKGIFETAHRVKQVVGQIFRYAIITGRADRDPSSDLRGALTPVRTQNFATITDPKEIGGLLRAIDGYSGSYIVKCALQFAPLVFVRPGELRHAEWKEFDFKNALWKIPAEKMKMGRVHIVPLATQAMAILEALKRVTGSGRYLFPSIRTTSRPMSENTINAALRRMGFEKTEMTGHGFRAMASTLLYENGFESQIIEIQLAHAEQNSVRAAYNHAQFLEKRKNMMQWWADYIDSLKVILLDIH